VACDAADHHLGYHLKTGHTLSVQNRPTGLAEDVSDVDDSPWVSEQRRRSPQVLQPAIAVLLLDRIRPGKTIFYVR
jgi:hypothetical protein